MILKQSHNHLEQLQLMNDPGFVLIGEDTGTCVEDSVVGVFAGVEPVCERNFASVRTSAIERHTVVCLCVCLSPAYLLARAHAIASKSFYKLLGIISWI